MELITTNANTATTTGTYWPYQTTPATTYYLHTCISYDRGEKAFKLAQVLLEKQLVEARTAKQFIEVMQAMLEVL